MTTTRPDPSNTALEEALAALRAAPQPPSAALVARVLADAAREQSAHEQAARAGTPAPAGVFSLRAAVAAVVGAARRLLPAPAGLAAAIVLGVWLGVDPPEPVLAVEEVLFGAVLEFDLADAFPGLDDHAVAP